MPTMLAGADVERLRVSLSSLLTLSTFGDAVAWRRDAACGLRDLVGADAAFVAVESATSSHLAFGIPASTVDEYERHYRHVDHGIARQRTLRIELWNRRMLWGESELSRSEYYNDFALPNRLYDAAGVAAHLPGVCVRVSLLYGSPPPRGCIASSGEGKRLRLLRLALPAFRVGALLTLRWRSRQDDITQVMDRVTQPLALYSGSGQLLHENPTLAAATPPPDDAELRGALRRVALAAARTADPSAADVTLSTAHWRVTGSRIDGDEPDHSGPAVLVSLEPRTGAGAPVDLLRARYSLTTREMQVLALLRDRHSNAEIADALGISEHTARHHTEHVLVKLGLTSRRRIEARYAQLGAEGVGGGAGELLSPR